MAVTRADYLAALTCISPASQVTASITHGRSLRHIRLQPVPHTVTATSPPSRAPRYLVITPRSAPSRPPRPRCRRTSPPCSARRSPRSSPCSRPYSRPPPMLRPGQAAAGGARSAARLRASARSLAARPTLRSAGRTCSCTAPPPTGRSRRHLPVASYQLQVTCTIVTLLATCYLLLTTYHLLSSRLPNSPGRDCARGHARPRALPPLRHRRRRPRGRRIALAAGGARAHLWVRVRVRVRVGCYPQPY